MSRYDPSAHADYHAGAGGPDPTRLTWAVGLTIVAAILAACTTAQLQTGLAEAQEVCQIASVNGPVFVALADANGIPMKTTNKGAAVIQADCAAIAAIPAPGAKPSATVALPPPG